MLSNFYKVAGLTIVGIIALFFPLMIILAAKYNLQQVQRLKQIVKDVKRNRELPVWSDMTRSFPWPTKSELRKYLIATAIVDVIVVIAIWILIQVGF